MAQNYIISGDVIDYVIPSATTITSGQVVVIAAGGLHGIALNSGSAGQTISVQLEGVFTIGKPTTSGNTFAAGAKVYYDTATGKASVDNTKEYIGHAIKAAAQSATTVDVRLEH